MKKRIVLVVALGCAMAALVGINIVQLEKAAAWSCAISWPDSDPHCVVATESQNATWTLHTTVYNYGPGFTLQQAFSSRVNCANEGTYPTPLTASIPTAMPGQTVVETTCFAYIDEADEEEGDGSLSLDAWNSNSPLMCSGGHAMTIKWPGTNCP